MSRKARKKKKSVKTILSFPSVIFLYSDANRFLEMSRENLQSHKVVDLKQRGTYARASILLFASSVEAILNHLLENIAFKDLSSSLQQRMERLPYSVKLLEVVQHSVKSRKNIKSTKLFLKLEELHKLRNSFAHPRDLSYQIEAKQSSKIKGKQIPKFAILDRKDYFPISKLQKNFMLIDYKDAKIARSIVDTFLQWLARNLKDEDKETLSHLKIHFPKSTTDKKILDTKIGEKLEFVLSGKGKDLIDFVYFVSVARRNKRD